MFYKKQSIPEVGDIVICTVKRILPHSVFVELDEYKNLEAMLHISEISPGRIRNIRDYVKEGKVIICKVLRKDLVKRHIDVSLRRVNKSQGLNKKEEYKQEQKAEKILDNIAKKLNQDLATLYKEVGCKIIEKYSLLSYGMQSFLQDPSLLKEFNFPKKTEELLLETIREKIKIPEVKITAQLNLVCGASNGIEIIKKVLKKIEDNQVKIHYLGAPKYNITIISPDYKTAEEEFKKVQDIITNVTKENSCEANLIKSK